METFKQYESYVDKSIQDSAELKKLNQAQLLQFAVTGLNEEAGEVAGLLCRESYKGREMPEERWLEELGDVFWYLVAAAHRRGFTLQDLVKYNMDKLEVRYGKG